MVKNGCFVNNTQTSRLYKHFPLVGMQRVPFSCHTHFLINIRYRKKAVLLNV